MSGSYQELDVNYVQDYYKGSPKYTLGIINHTLFSISTFTQGITKYTIYLTKSLQGADYDVAALNLIVKLNIVNVIELAKLVAKIVSVLDVRIASKGKESELLFKLSRDVIVSRVDV